MKLVTKAGAWCNGEVAYLAWSVDKKIDDCLGFMITRVHESGADKGQRRCLPTWIAFIDQSNPNWVEQDSSVWPIQRFDWRDLTLRKSRNTTAVRPIDFDVHYEIVPVTDKPGAGRKPIPPSATAPTTVDSQPAYVGKPRPLFQIGEPTVTNTIHVTHDYGDGETKISATFTNGILSTQNLVRQLQSVGKAPPKKILKAAKSGNKAVRIAATKQKEDHLLSTLKAEIKNAKSPIRKFLTGDVYDFLTRLLDRAEKENGEVYLALYELHDQALIDKLAAGMAKGRVHIILSSTGSVDPNLKDTPKEKRVPAIWDSENDPARRKLVALAKGKLAGRVTDRMFNNSARIGHNKFAVYVKGGKAVAVLTGSTNWTETGLCTQSNNVLIVEDATLANDYWDYWKRLQADPQPKRVAVSARKGKDTISGAAPNKGVQGQALRTANATSAGERKFPGKVGTGQVWCSPNTKPVTVPKNSPATPPDLDMVYTMMRGAKQALLFLSFLPGMSGKNNIIGVAAEMAEKNKDLLVLGAISDPKALPPPSKPGEPPTFVDAKGKTQKVPPPAIWWPKGQESRIAMIRAAAVKIPYGDLRPELLTAGHAIIHNKIIIIDPLDEKNCVVMTGSHNNGFKASYCNDENLLIVRGNRELAICYAVHVLDLYDHYVFRARLEDDLRRQLIAGKIKSYDEAASEAKPGGLLRTDASWQDTHFEPHSKSSLEYFLGAASAAAPVKRLK